MTAATDGKINLFFSLYKIRALEYGYLLQHIADRWQKPNLVKFFGAGNSVNLEDLAEKDATEKSDAAREAFLAELALDSKKGARGGSDNSKHTHDKTKDKKRNKDFRKTKDLKSVGGNQHDMVHDETSERVSYPEFDGDHLDSETGVSVNGDDLKLLEEEFRQQNKRFAQTFPEKVTEGVCDVYLDHGADDLELHEPIKPLTPVHLMSKNGFPSNSEGEEDGE
ncbi:hypothetical protein Pint_00723 [Pistacia integerrima]|uniref:Uncharacterized protein n=1 Tax=Pistacia integerrima TaxID=434235 RepID=A0ACC0ZFS2_9ROSI|nr:hypothetical protein Pint_00723 [Pistacia integerrima]